jgi:hypothetical protein
MISRIFVEDIVGLDIQYPPSNETNDVYITALPLSIKKNDQ